MDEFIAVYLYDVKRAIEEVESYFIGYPMQYDVFEKDFLRRSAVERKAEIMGEARYPSYKERLMRSLNADRCKEPLKQTDELRIWIKSKL